MFWYAIDKTDWNVPLRVFLAHQLNRKIADLRQDESLRWA